LAADNPPTISAVDGEGAAEGLDPVGEGDQPGA